MYIDEVFVSCALYMGGMIHDRIMFVRGRLVFCLCAQEIPSVDEKDAW